jgi:hypothetical protein
MILHRRHMKPRLDVFALLLCLLAVACAQRTTQPDVNAQEQPPTPMVMCTAPLCWDDEMYYCPAECPGGCGTTCATRTPDPNAGPTPTFPAPASGCTLPTPDPDAVGPALYVCASTTTVGIGETVSLFAEVINAADPIFVVRGQNLEGTESLYVRAKATNRTMGWYSSGATLDLVSVQASDSQFYAELRALAPGTVEIAISAAPPYPALYADPLTITVQP